MGRIRNREDWLDKEWEEEAQRGVIDLYVTRYVHISSLCAKVAQATDTHEMSVFYRVRLQRWIEGLVALGYLKESQVETLFAMPVNEFTDTIFNKREV
jgi:hypothetical protein